jgi:hypothetical protein
MRGMRAGMGRRPRAWRAWVVLPFGAALAVVSTAPAAAVTVTLGEIAPPGSTGPADAESFQVQTGATSPSYAVPPGDWTIIAWSVQSGTMDGIAELQVWRPMPGVNQHTLVAESGPATVPAGTSPSFSTSILVQEGEVLGINTESGNIDDFVTPGGDGNVVRRVFPTGSDPAVGQTVGSPGDFGYNELGGRVNVAATLEGPDPEPQAGDTTPPDTKILKGPKKRTHKRKAKIHFGSSEPAGATFVCSIDDGGPKPCKSPERFKVGRGKHRFTVQAVDASGNIDPTPAERRWRVKREKQERDGNEGH